MNNSRVLILSDTHFPYEKPMYLNWIRKLKAKIKPTNVIHIGDLADFNSLSFFDKSPYVDPPAITPAVELVAVLAPPYAAMFHKLPK